MSATEEKQVEQHDSRPDTWVHIGAVRMILKRVIDNLQRRADVHDQSKLEEPELAVFNEFTPLLRDSTYGSPEYKGFLAGMGEGLKHHYAHNDHHPEHWPDGIAEMGLVEMTEMLCDWLAATQRHADGDIRGSIKQNAERFGYGPEIERLLLNSLTIIEADPS